MIQNFVNIKEKQQIVFATCVGIGCIDYCCYVSLLLPLTMSLKIKLLFARHIQRGNISVLQVWVVEFLFCSTYKSTHFSCCHSLSSIYWVLDFPYLSSSPQVYQSFQLIYSLLPPTP